MTKKKKEVTDSGFPKENVTLFGGPASDWDKDHNNHHGAFFGALVLGGGILLLLNTMEILPLYIWGSVWRFWPVLLILWGLQIILGHNNISRFVVNTIGIALIFLIVLFAISEVRPELLINLHPVFTDLFNILKGVSQ